MNARFVPAILGALAVLCLVAMGVNSAMAQQSQCAPHAELVKFLEQKYKEVRLAIGLVNQDQLFEVFASPQGTWTMVITNAGGKSCIEGAGDNFAFDTTAFEDAKKGEAF